MGWDTRTQIRVGDRCSNMERFGDYMQIDCELVTFDLNSRLRRQPQNAVRDYKCKAIELENSTDYKITRCIYSRQELK